MTFRSVKLADVALTWQNVVGQLREVVGSEKKYI
jgi:hypothetical protein